MKILDGKKTAEKIKKELSKNVQKLKKRGITPGLAFFVTDNPAAESYVKIKEQVAQQLGIYTVNRKIKNPTTNAVIKLINKWNKDKKIHGIVVQLPLPKSLDTLEILDSILPSKDVDGLGQEHLARLYSVQPGFVPATPLGVLTLLERYHIPIAGKHAVIVGRSMLVGKPLALLLLNKNATVTVAHSKTENLGAITKTADILISAVGKPGLIKKDMVKRGAAVIDVGISKIGLNPVQGTQGSTLVGDVDFENVKKVASYISPVPGGVGPMTVVMLLKNVVESAQQLNK